MSELEEAAENYNDDFQIKGGSKAPHIKNQHIMNHFIAGANWQAERMYSEEDIQKAFKAGFSNGFASDILSTEKLQKEKERLFCEWFEQFKNK